MDESFRANTRAGLTHARSLSTWVYSERNAVTHLPGHSPSCRVSCNLRKWRYLKIKRKEKIESRKTSVRKNTPFSALRSQNALKTPRLRSLKYWELLDTFDDSFTSTTCLYLSPSQLCLIKRDSNFKHTHVHAEQDRVMCIGLSKTREQFQAYSCACRARQGHAHRSAHAHW